MKQLFSCLILFFAGMAKTQPPQFRHYSVNEGLANSMVYYAMQDSRGFLWFCTESGVNRFDGKQFETFTTKNGLADNENFRCIEDSEGRIWFSSYNGKLCYFNGRVFVNERTDTGLKYNTEVHRHIADMIEGPEGNIWFAKHMTENIFRFNGKKTEEYPVKASYNKLYVKLLFNYRDTLNYFRFYNKTMFRENPASGKSKVLFHEKLHEGETILLACMKRIDANTFYFLTSEGIRHFRNDSVFIDVNTKDLGLDLYKCMVSFLLKGEDLWIATAGKGLVRIKNFKTKGFQGKFESFLGSVTVSHLTSDNEGGLWVTTLSEGVYYIPQPSGYITNIPEKSVTSVAHNSLNNNTAIGTYYGSFKVFSGDSVIRSFRFEHAGATRIKEIRWLSETKVLLGMDSDPYLFDMKTGKVSVILKNQKLAGFSDTDEGTAGIWIGNRSWITLMNGNESRIVYENINSGAPEKLFAVAEGGAEGCWFATVKDVFRFDLKTGKKNKVAGYETFNSNLKDLKHVNGFLWVATDGNGLFIFNNGKLLKHICSHNSPATSDVCQKLVFDGRENIWVATNKGINVFNTRGDFVMSLTSNDILINNDIKDMCLHAGKAYIATPAGISIINIKKFVTLTEPPRVHFTVLTVDGINYPAYGQKEFRYFDGIIQLNYTAITFQANQSLQYKYKIEGGENQWNYTSSGQIQFYDLKPGTYKIFLSARKYNSDWSVPALFGFTVTPLWYQTAWFRSLVIVCLTLLVFLLVYVIIRRNKQKHLNAQKMLESELKAIRLYMNPHFIFNTLHSLQLFIFKSKPLEASDYISRFSKLIRWIMSYSDRQEITLEEEMEFLKTYIELEQLRFEKTFHWSFRTDKSLSEGSTYIPPLIIQPFVENAIKYGLPRKNENGILSINFEKVDGNIRVIVEDNGVGREQVRKEQMLSGQEKKSTGIKYTEERLKLLFGGTQKELPVKITDLFNQGAAAGTRVELLIPVLL